MFDHLLTHLSTGRNRVLIETQDYVSKIVDQLEPIGPIQFCYILVVTARGEPSIPILYITAEKSALDRILGQDISERNPDFEFSPDYHLCVYDNEKIDNYGTKERLDDLSVFKSEAIEIIKNKLDIEDEFKITDIDIDNVLGQISGIINEIRKMNAFEDLGDIMEKVRKMRQLDVSEEVQKEIDHLWETLLKIRSDKEQFYKKQLGDDLYQQNFFNENKAPNTEKSRDPDGCLFVLLFVAGAIGLIVLFRVIGGLMS